MKQSILKIITLVIQLGIMAFLLLFIVMGRPQWLDIRIGQSQTVYTTWLGFRTVTFILVPQSTADHGPATIFIEVNGLDIGEIESQYDYDTLMNIPAGRIHWSWIDNDWIPDVVIHVSGSGASCFVSSQSGRLHLMDP